MKKFTLWIILGALATIAAASLIIGSGLFEKHVRGTALLYVQTADSIYPSLATSDKMRAYQMVKAYHWPAHAPAQFDTAYAAKLGPDMVKIPVRTEVDIFRVLKDSALAEIRAKWVLENGQKVTYIGYVPYKALQEIRMK